jgi:hypothetical protein
MRAMWPYAVILVVALAIWIALGFPLPRAD